MYLIIRVNHDDDVSARRQSEAVAGLLVAAVTAVHRMNLHLRMLEGSRDGDGVVGAGVIHQNDQVDDPLRHDLVVGLLQSPRGIVAGMTTTIFWFRSIEVILISCGAASARTCRGYAR